MLPKHYWAVLRRAKWLVSWLAIFACVVFIGTFLAFLRTPLVSSDRPAVNIIFPAGSSLWSFSDHLKQQGLLIYPRSYFVILAYVRQASKLLHAGEYVLEPGILPGAFLTKLINDDVLWRNLLFVEGTTWSVMRQQLLANVYLQQNIAALSESQLAAKLHLPSQHVEGWFFPDTYRYTAGLSDLTLLRQAHQAMVQRLNKAWATRQAGLPYRSPYDLLIVASLVEKEAKIPQDYAKIAGVIIKRLAIGMPLQIDASVIYGLGEQYDGQLKWSQLKQDSPYNTYLHKGLPPTPIAMPGQASLNAAAQPSVDKALFYVATGTGGHVFSATLREQNQAVAHYRRYQHQHVHDSYR